MLGASLLALRTFRDSYLKIWVVGWAALLASHLAEHCLAAKFPAPFDQVVVHAAFVLAVGLLACAVLVYARMRDLILPLMVITPVLVGFAGARVLLWPDSVPLRVALEISYRFVLLTAAVSLLRARRGRWEPAAWLLALTLPMLHLGWSPFTDAVPLGASIAIEVAVGLSMLLVVFDEARGRTRRLIAMQRITEQQLARIEGRNDIEQFLAERTARIPVGRRIEPEEVAKAVLWLAFDAPDYVTAERLNVSGGLDKD